MSTDFDIVCDECKLRMHAGQVSAMVPAFGHSSQDSGGRRTVAKFAFEHAYHGSGVRVVVSDTLEAKRSDSYQDLEYEVPPAGSGDFSIGSRIWPGTSKVIEEMGELQQVLGKLIAIAGDTKHWDGDLRRKLVEELGDLSAALIFFKSENMTHDELLEIAERAEKKLALFRQWHKDPTKP
jgi:hypothetical protein